jgi:hypothetical protein
MEKLRAWCERRTPLERPEVPDDQRMTAVRAGAVAGGKMVAVFTGVGEGARRVRQSGGAGGLGWAEG